MKLAAIALLACLSLGCGPAPPSPEPPPAPAPAVERCEAAGTNLALLDPPKACGIVTPSGASYREVCANAARHALDLATDCVTTAASCEAARACLAKK